MKKASVVILFVSTLIGCSSGSQNARTDYVFEENNNAGLMVISARLNPNNNCIKVMDTLALNYKGVGKGPDRGESSSLLNIQNFLISHDFKDPDGYFYVHEVMPGNYELYGLHYMAGAGASAIFTGYNFEIKPNQVNYLGEMVVTVDSCGTNHGDTKALLTFSNKKERDKELFRQRVPNVKSELTFITVTPGATIGN